MPPFRHSHPAPHANLSRRSCFVGTLWRPTGANCRNSRLGRSLTFLFLVLSLIKSRRLRPISAGSHTAPPPAVILRRVIEVQNTIRVLAFFEIGEVPIAEQIGGGFGDWRKQPSGITEVGAEMFLEALLCLRNFGVTILLFHYQVDRLDHRRLDSCATLGAKNHLPQRFSKVQREFQYPRRLRSAAPVLKQRFCLRQIR